MGKQGPCHHCGITRTAQWRGGPPAKPVLCNACGWRWRTKGSLVNYMPVGVGDDPQKWPRALPPRKRKDPPAAAANSDGVANANDPANANDAANADGAASQVGHEEASPNVMEVDAGTPAPPLEARVPSRKRSDTVRNKASSERLSRSLISRAMEISSLVTLHAVTKRQKQQKQQEEEEQEQHHKHQNHQSLQQASGVDEVRCLFEEQQKYLDYFFWHLDYGQVQRLTQICFDAQGVILISAPGSGGDVAVRISQTLVSTGTKSRFLSPTDSGGVAMVEPKDVAILLSKSGGEEELLSLVPRLKAKGAFVVGVSSLAYSQLKQVCDMHLHLPLERELCPFAPVTSSAIQMVFGDVVAVALMQAKNLSREEDRAVSPPDFKKVCDVMTKQSELPLIKEHETIVQRLVELGVKGCGCLIVVDERNCLVGTFADADLRRALASKKEEALKLPVGDLCNRTPKTTTPNATLVEVIQKMQGPPCQVEFLPVLDESNVVQGMVTQDDLFDS